jgi:hypothetical protein
MLTFSSICDDFVKANGLEKDECSSDDEAKKKAAALDTSHLSPLTSHLSPYTSHLPQYPVRYFTSDTTGEKAYEEFYVPGEKIDMQRFAALGVVEQTSRHSMQEVCDFFASLERIFAREDFTKAEVVEAIKTFIPNFAHEEKGKHLDQKM